MTTFELNNDDQAAIMLALMMLATPRSTDCLLRMAAQDKTFLNTLKQQLDN